MTTKIKIISGFLLMVFLLGGVATSAYKDLQGTANGLQEYNRVANLNTITSDLSSAFNLFEAEIYQYLDAKKKENMDNAVAALETVFKKLDEADKLVKVPERVAALKTLRAQAQTIRQLREKVATGTSEAYAQYLNAVQPATRDLGAKLMSIASLAREVNNKEVAYVVSQALEQLATSRSGLSRFAENRSMDDAAKIDSYIDTLGELLKSIEPLLMTEGGKKAYADIIKSYATVHDAFNAMHGKFSDVGKSLNEISDLLTRSTAMSDEVSKNVDAQARQLSSDMLSETATAQSTLMTTGIVGLLLGVLIATFIVLGLIRVLNDLAGFAAAIAKGDFGYAIKVREKGEIGVMIESMRQIPRVLDMVIGQANDLSDKISSGFLRSRLDVNEFNGSFSNLATGINTVSNAYTGLLDAIALPMMGCDKKNSIIFLNKIAQDILGGNYTKEQCRDHLNAKECNSGECFGNCAMSKNATHTGETTIKAKGRRMEVSVSALPLHNLKNEVVGYIEILSDLTEIKDKQAVVMKAVSEASEISDRVAAASEELAAQVEQISHGAELQRSRLESTSSAMTEMNATVLEVARSASQASEQSEDTRHKATDGANLVNKVVGSINQVNTVAVTLQSNMQELGKQAESIGGVMNVISDIADQTNLLALNAAIEAARAGEAGRGFAVVADEVRKLAEKTMVATQEVGSNINAIQNSARTNISEVSNAVKSISEATGLANSSGVALKEIVELAAANSSVVTSIATAAEEQSATSEEINRSIEEINHVVGETTDGMIQSSAAVQDLSRMAQELRRVMDTLK